MNPSKNTWLALLQGLFLIIVGLFFIFRPESALKTVSIYIGIMLLILAVIGGMRVSSLRNSGSANGGSYAIPLVLLIAGIVLIFFSTYAFTVLALSVGVWLFMDGFSQVRDSSALSKFDVTLGRALLVMGILTILLSIVIFINPQGLVRFVGILFGASLAISGFFLVILGLSTQK